MDANTDINFVTQILVMVNLTLDCLAFSQNTKIQTVKKSQDHPIWPGVLRHTTYNNHINIVYTLQLIADSVSAMSSYSSSFANCRKTKL